MQSIETLQNEILQKRRPKNFSPGKKGIYWFFLEKKTVPKKKIEWQLRGLGKRRKWFAWLPVPGKNSPLSHGKNSTHETEEDMWKIESNDFYFFLHQQRQSKELTLFQHKSWRENYKWKFQSAEGGTKKSREKRKAEWNFTTWGRQKLSPLFANCCLPTKLKQFRTLYSRFSPSLSPFSAAIFLFLTIRDAVAHKFCWFDAHFPNGLEGENSWRGGVCLSWIWMHFNIWELQRKWIGKLRKLQLLERWVWNLYCYLLGGF